MPGHIDEGEPEIGREFKMGESDIDGDAAALFFGEAVGIDAGERLHQSGLAMIDVAGRSDDDVFQGYIPPQRMTASSKSSSPPAKKWSRASTKWSSLGSA